MAPAEIELWIGYPLKVFKFLDVIEYLVDFIPKNN
jgi:hypothetical protein